MKNRLVTLFVVAMIPFFAFSSDLAPNSISTGAISESVSPSKFDVGTYDPIKNTRWGTDVEVYTGNVNAISYDYDRITHNMFSLVITNNGGSNDSINIYKSVDFGSSWYLWYTYLESSNYASDAKLIVTDNADSVWVSFVGLFQNNGGDLYWNRIPESDSSINYWTHLSDNNGDTIYYFDAAYRDSFVYVAFCGKDTSIYSNQLAIMTQVYNLNNNDGWVDKTGLFAEPYLAKPAIAAGKDGNVYVAFLENRFHVDTMNIRLKKSSSFGSSWEGSIPISNNSADKDLRDVSIAASNDSVIWIGRTYYYDPDYDWGYYYSVDGGSNFSYSGPHYISGHIWWDQHLGTMAMNKAGNSMVTVAFKEDTTNTHNVVFGYIMKSDPSHFYNDSLEVISDYSATNTFSPVAGTKITQIGPYYIENSAVLYGGWGPLNVYFDGFNFTGVKEKVRSANKVFSISSPSISKNNIDIKLTIGKAVNVKAEIYNLSGQKIKSLFSGYRSAGVYNMRWNRRDNNNNMVSRGIYLIRVSAENDTQVRKIVLIK